MGDDDRSRGDLLAEVTKLRQENADLQQQLEELEETRAELAMSQDRLSRLFDAAPYAVFLETLAGTIVDCNQRAVEMLGYTRDELLGMHVGKLVPKQVADTLPKLINEQRMMGGAFVRAVNVRKDGEEFPVEVSTRLVNLTDGKHAFVAVRELSDAPVD
ncbi:MAG: PAS domain S-box protein [Deltaproteobacteria bacterium]|nr:PAS domain S-box protein [Deltaproteobacteria bacterium]